MRFPRTESENADARTSAFERLDEARAEQRELAARRDAAQPGPRAEQAASELHGADEHVAARAAWADWAAHED